MSLASAKASDQLDSDVMKITGKFVAERKDISSETGSQKIHNLSDSQGPAVVSVPERKKHPQKFGNEHVEIWMKWDA